MTSAKIEFDGLLNDAIEMAIRLIEKHVNHIPFVMAITISGERLNIASDDTQTSDIDVLLDGLRKHLAQNCSPPWKYRAVALAQNVEYTSALDGKRTDAIKVTLDHLAEKPVTCFLPYTLANGKVTPGELFAVDPEESFFSLK